jgi:hypothetical protein
VDVRACEVESSVKTALPRSSLVDGVKPGREASAEVEGVDGIFNAALLGADHEEARATRRAGYDRPSNADFLVPAHVDVW